MAERYVVRVENGNVKLFGQNGDLKRCLCNSAQNAVVKGDEVHVTMKDNKVKVFSVNGFYKKTL